MVLDNDDQETSGDDEQATRQQNRGMGWSRRTLLEVTGVGAVVATLGAAYGGRASGQDEDDETETPTETETGTETPTDTVYDDLVDPVFGYPLSVGETDEADLETVVAMVSEEGEGAHEEFPPEVPAEFYFDPVGLLVEPNTVVQFSSTAGLHTTTAYHEKYSEPPQFTIPTRIPDDATPFSSPPVTPGESWLYAFQEAGVYDLLCLPHVSLGMVMRVVVMEADSDEVPAAPTGEFLNAADEAVLTAPELDPENIVEEGTVAWADLTIEVPETPTGTHTQTPTETGSE